MFLLDPDSSPPDPAEVARIEARQRDHALVQRAMAGERAAMDELAGRLECVGRMVRALSRRFGRALDEHAIQDIGQDVVVGVLDRLDSYQGRSTLETWLYRFCFHQVMNALRKQNRRAVFELEEPHLIPVSDDENEHVDVERLERAIQGLKPPRDEIVRLRHFRGLGFGEIASSLDQPLNTVRSHYFRARNRLRELLASPGDADA